MVLPVSVVCVWPFIFARRDGQSHAHCNGRVTNGFCKPIWLGVGCESQFPCHRRRFHFAVPDSSECWAQIPMLWRVILVFILRVGRAINGNPNGTSFGANPNAIARDSRILAPVYFVLHGQQQPASVAAGIAMIWRETRVYWHLF